MKATKTKSKSPKVEQPVMEEEVFISTAQPVDGGGEDWDTPREAVPSSLLGPAKDRSASKPDISRLPDAMGPGPAPLFVRGDKIVIERYASILAGNPYLDTRTYVVESVDTVTGKVNLWDPAMAQFATDNWKHGVKHGYVYKFARSGVAVSSKRKRGRPRKNPVEAPKPVELGADGMPVKKKRGRPAGVKNRPKEVVAAEKAAKAKLRAAKASVRKKAAAAKGKKTR